MNIGLQLNNFYKLVNSQQCLQRIVDIIKAMDYICRTLRYVYSMFVCVVIFVALISFANDVPEHEHSWTSLDEDIVLKLEWINPCGEITIKHHNETRNRSRNLLKPLKDAVKTFIHRLNGPNMNAINTSDISEWFKWFNSTYSFLHQINPTAESINLPKRHVQTQTFVGAFQYLAEKQNRFDRLQNEGNTVTNEIDELLILAKNLLCEIETVIHNTRQRIPVALTREQMDTILTFRNNNRMKNVNSEIDELDNKFAKVRFHEYVHNFQLLLNHSSKRNFRSHNSIRELK